MAPKRPLHKPRIVDLMGEVWKPIPGYEDYAVSNMGRVRSSKQLKRYGYPVLIKPVASKGYHRVSLMEPSKRNGKSWYKLHFIHTLVLITFVRAAREGEQALHGNGNPQDNRLTNLRWGSAWENSQDKVKHGTMVKGTQHHATYLSEEQVVAIWKEVRTTPKTYTQIARDFGTTKHVVSRISRRQTWQHVTKNLPDTYDEEAQEE